MSGITSVSRITGAVNNLVYLESEDSSATVFATGYLTAQASTLSDLNEGEWVWESNDLVIVSASDGVTIATVASGLASLTAYAGLGATTQAVSVSSATPGTVRALTGKITESAATMTSGNIVGVRGEANLVSASGGFVYGVQGKIIPTGTLSGSVWAAAVFGQLDVSAATINAGQVATLWGDWGATGATATSMSGARMVALTNTTANVLNAIIYSYGSATNLLELSHSGTPAFYLAAGTSAGSAGDATKCAAQQVLRITVNGSSVYIPVFTQNT